MIESKTINEIALKHNYNGCILIAKDNIVLFSNGFGYYDNEKNIKNNPDFPMRIASITKTFTAVAVLKLVEDGTISLKDKITKYLPNLKYKDITIHHLLSNSSGISGFSLDYDFKEIVKSDNFLESLLEIFINEPLEFPTGSRFGYSVSGYLVLQYIIEKVTGHSYYDYLKGSVFDPLDMSNTYIEDNYYSKDDMATPYKLMDGTLQEVDPFDMRIAGAGGGILSTVNDIHKLNQVILNRKILKESTSKEIYQKQIEINDTTAYGYGMIVNTFEQDNKKHLRLYHPGGGFGVRSINTILLNERIEYILVSNLEDKDIFNRVYEEIHTYIIKKL